MTLSATNFVDHRRGSTESRQQQGESASVDWERICVKVQVAAATGSDIAMTFDDSLNNDDTGTGGGDGDYVPAGALAVGGDDDEDSALDISEQTNRPPDVALLQQRILAWQPILDPLWSIVALFYLGVIMIPVGFKMIWLSEGVVENTVTYDGYNIANPLCGINNTYNARENCTLEIEILEDMKSPVLVYYEIENFYQNYRQYFQSYDEFQLAGYVGTQDALSQQRCEPLNVLGNTTLNPCGMIANTFFNDIFTLVEGMASDGTALKMYEEGIAWQSDIEYRYHQPDGFNWSVCPPDLGCDPACCEQEGVNSTCLNGKPYEDSNGTCYRYFYPNDDSTQYLYETYPHIISPLDGVTNEHFIVWMKVATLNKFRKLYGYFNQSISAGTKLVFKVEANWAVTPFKGSKALVVTTNNIFGGKNNYTGTTFVGIGIFLIACGFFFTLKQVIRPRKLADKSYLHFKQD